MDTINALGDAYGFIVAAGDGGLSTGGLTGWIKDNVIDLLIIAGACVALFAGARGQISKGITVFAGIIVGLVVLGLATGNNAEGLAKGLFGLFQ